MKPQDVGDTGGAGRPEAGEGQVFLGTADEPASDLPLEQLSRVYRLGDPALSELALTPLLNELLTRVRNILAVDTVAILLIDEERKALVARAAKGLEEEVEQGMSLPIGRGFAGRIAAERSPIFIADVDHADVLNPILRTKGVRSLLGAPLITEGEVVGVLHVGTLAPRVFTNEMLPSCSSRPRGPGRQSSARASSTSSSGSIAPPSHSSAAWCPSGFRRSSESRLPPVTCRRATRSGVIGTT